MFKYLIGIVVIVSVILFLWAYSTKRQYITRLKDEENRYEEINFKTVNKLPYQIENYLLYTKTKEAKVSRFKLSMSGQMRQTVDEAFNEVKVTQETFLSSGSRLFLMEMKYKGLMVRGIHDYNTQYAQMKIKVLDFFTVVNEKNDIMHKAETVTYLNDLCIFAPSSLKYENVTFKEIDEYTVSVSLTKHGYTVSAELHFDEDYRLVNFVSFDRYMVIDGEYKKTRWETPLTEYKMQGDYYLPYLGSAIWVMEDGNFEYIKLIIDEVTYN